MLKISTEELDYLRRVASKKDAVMAALASAEPAGRSPKLQIPLDATAVQTLMEILSTCIAQRGFDENYEPNEEGQALESLIGRCVQIAIPSGG